MKKYILPLLVAGSLLGACTNEDESIFEQSAAERLEAGQRGYFQTLCEQGGTWVMEYFSNPEEQGYVFVMQFESDKSVTIHADHKWIGGAYKSEKSLWDVINDDGNVLTFNSYNTLFHVFSTPENILGTHAPKDDTGEDIDELGYGHSGDYEFMLMESDGNTIRLRGKKRGIYAYLRRIPSDTDAKAYLEQITVLRKQFDARRFPNYVMTETSTGAQYDVTGLADGVVSVVPLNTSNPNGQTVERACILTTAGMRPITAFDFIREDNSHFTVDEFTWDADGSLVAPGVRLTASSPGFNLGNVDQDLKWALDKSTMSPSMAAAHDEASAATGNGLDLRKITIGFNANNGEQEFSVTIMAGSRTCRDYYALTISDDQLHANLTFISANRASSDLAAATPEYERFKKLFEGDFAISNVAPMDPSAIVFKSQTNPDVSFTAKVQ